MKNKLKRTFIFFIGACLAAILSGCATANDSDPKTNPFNIADEKESHHDSIAENVAVSDPQVLAPPTFDLFLGEADFEGQRVAAPGPVGNGGLQATYNGVMTFTNLQRSQVNQLLPGDFVLATRKTTHLPNLHPVVLLFGDQTDGGWVTGPNSSQPSGIHYSEMILAIPFVQKRTKDGWHTYIVRMYLDNAAAVAGGEIFGYRKVFAWVEWKGDNLRIFDRTNLSDYLVGEFEWQSPWFDGNDALTHFPHFADMVSIVTTELLGEFGPLKIKVCSQFEWDLSDAEVAAAKTSYSMKIAFRSDMSGWPALSPFVNVPGGAVVMRGVRWRLNPGPYLTCRY